MIKVRATQDGMYAGHYWNGPIDSDQGTKAGDVFEVDETPFEMKDENGRPVLELTEKGKPIVIMHNGKPKIDKDGDPIYKIKMTTFFSPTWMERVPDDTELTYPDREPFKIPEPYRLKKTKPGKMVALPQEVTAAAGIESPI
jgi:hypothetical protein